MNIVVSPSESKKEKRMEALSMDGGPEEEAEERRRRL